MTGYSLKDIKDNESGQVIALVGFTIALSLVIFATVFYSAGMAGQKIVEQECDDFSFVFNDVKSIYGRILKEVSKDGTSNPFNESEFDELKIMESQIKKLTNKRGYVLVFSGHDYNSSTKIANVTIMLFDAETKYTDRVAYNLTLGESG